MVTFEPTRSRLVVTDPELRVLFDLALDPGAVAEPPEPVDALERLDVLDALRAARVVAGDEVEPMAAGIVGVVAAPHRSVVVERFDGRTLDPLTVWWRRDGHAALGMLADGGAALDLQATQLELLPALLAQALALGPRPPVPEPITVTTTTAVLDGAFGPDGEVGDLDDEHLEAIAGGWQRSWRATGSWVVADAAADPELAVVDAGVAGLWEVDRGADGVVRLHARTVHEVLDRLGDVVTGRRQPPRSADAVDV